MVELAPYAVRGFFDFSEPSSSLSPTKARKLRKHENEYTIGIDFDWQLEPLFGRLPYIVGPITMLTFRGNIMG